MPIYVVFISDSQDVVDKITFSTFEAAVKEAKKHKDARIKKFCDEGDLGDFLKTYSPNFLVPAQDAVDSKLGSPDIGSSKEKLPFPSLSPQNMVKFRKLIEEGDSKGFLDRVWTNPRYLISSGDSPTILKEGPRYNALHIIAQRNQPVICKLLLNTICDRDFMKLMYPDVPEFWEQQISHLLDLYLNMPEKGFYETPLHFASKFGHNLIVEILVAFNCDINRLNKNGKKACDIICSRNTLGAKGLYDAIAEMLGVVYYIPVVSDVDDPTETHLEPPRRYGDLVAKRNMEENDSMITAVAGPMSPLKANVFYKEWKSVRQNNSPLLSHSKFEAKPEFVGRYLAKEKHIPWYEYWPFLHSFCDITSEEGLLMLENYLKNKHSAANNDLSIQSDTNFLDSSDSSFDESFGSLSESESFSSISGSESSPKTPITDLCDHMNRLDLNQSGDFIPNHLSKVLCQVAKMVAASILSTIGEEIPFQKCYPNMIDDYSSLTHFNHLAIAKDCYEHQLNAVKGVSLYDLQHISDCLLPTDSLYCILECVIDLIKGLQMTPHCRTDKDEIDKNDGDEQLETNFFTPPGSPEVMFGTPTEGPDIYIANHLTDKDIELATIIDYADIDQSKYPFISYWKSSVKKQKKVNRNLDYLNVAKRLEFTDC